MSPMPDNFAQRLKTLRKKAGLTQPELADLIGVHETTIRRWENDYANSSKPNIGYIQALAKALNVSENDLLNDPAPEKSGDWVITLKVADRFTKEEINLTGNIQPIAQITATPQGCAFMIQADWEMLKTKSSLEKLFKRIAKETYPAMRGTGIALGGLPQD